VDSDKLFPGLSGVCSAASVGGALPSRPDGALSFTATNADVSASVDVTVPVDFPNFCHSCRCTDLEASLTSAGLDASCSPVCNGGTCSCTIQKTVTISGTGKYTVSGGTLSITGGKSASFCVGSGTLALDDDTTGAHYVLRPPAALETPEICDGIDNDGNGMIDDDPVECPACSSAGACAGGVKATCDGGWSCVYTSPDWEREETRCDAVDNDCDGQINEGLDCHEICDGIDNDANGKVDDAARGGPTCTTVGVCSAGNASQCSGKAGWACVPKSTSFESAETKCDGADNDCNGLTDERCCAAGSARMYYAYVTFGDAGTASGSVVERSDLSGGSVQRLVKLPPATLLDVALDPVKGKMYWANLDAHAVQRSNVNGTNVEAALLPASSQPRLALDVGHRFIFWVGPAGLRRANLDDLASAIDVPAAVTPLTMTVDSQHGWLFMGAGNLIYRANLDGSGLISIGPDLPVIGQVIEGIAVDPVAAKVYWTSGGGLHRANLDLSSPEQLIQLNYPHHVHVDAVARRLYWSETISNDIGYMDIGSTTPSYVTKKLASIRLGDVVPCPP
jgi:hypothetical protein